MLISAVAAKITQDELRGGKSELAKEPPCHV